MTQIIVQFNMPKAQPEMEIVNNPLPNHPQIQAPLPQQGQTQQPNQPPNVAIIVNPDEKVPLPQGRQVWDFENVHDVQTLLSNPPRTQAPLPPFLNPTHRTLLRANVQVPFLNQDLPNFDLPFIILNQDVSIQSRFSNTPSQDTRNSLPPPPFINSDTAAQNMVLRSGRTFNQEPLP